MNDCGKNDHRALRGVRQADRGVWGADTEAAAVHGVLQGWEARGAAEQGSGQWPVSSGQ